MKKVALLIIGMSIFGVGACASPPPAPVVMALPSVSLLFPALTPLPDHSKDKLGTALLKERASNLGSRQHYTNARSSYLQLMETYGNSSKK